MLTYVSPFDDVGATVEGFMHPEGETSARWTGLTTLGFGPAQPDAPQPARDLPLNLAPIRSQFELDSEIPRKMRLPNDPA
jgi:hypothetical protein